VLAWACERNVPFKNIKNISAVKNTVLKSTGDFQNGLSRLFIAINHMHDPQELFDWIHTLRFTRCGGVQLPKLAEFKGIWVFSPLFPLA